MSHISRKLVPFALLLLLSISSFAQNHAPTAKVTGGEVMGRGWDDGKGATFRGIPFAAPPVGDLRWREPKPVKPWTGHLDATEFAPPCTQIDGGWNTRDSKLGKEDCLYLNIDTPEMKPQQPMAVMVWIHGGANAGGSGRTEGHVLAKRGVVVVNIQYRLGLLGFMAHPELTKESKHGSGNYGLLDQIAALKWVRDNIRQFGGDPAKVTIFGQSAGAYDITLLMTSPLAKGLFSRAIEESSPAIAGPRALPTLQEAEEVGERKAKQLNAPPTGAIAYLRKLPVEEVMKAEPPYGEGGLWANIDGHVLPNDPAEVYAKGKEQKVELIIGSNAREFQFRGKPGELNSDIEKFFGTHAQAALRAYGIAGQQTPPDEPVYGSVGEQFTTDTLFRCHSVDIFREHSRVAHTYQYEYSHPVPGREAAGATHSAELGHVWGTFFMGGAPTERDRKLSDAIQTYWTNFAKTGDPNGGDYPHWPAYDAKDRGYVDFTSDGPKVKANLRADLCAQYDAAVADEKGSRK